MGKKNNKSKKDNDPQIHKNLLVIAIVIFLIIVSLGLFFWKREKEQQEKFAELENKKKRLIIVKARILELEEKKHALEEMDKRALIGGRALVGFFIILLNCLFKYYYVYPFDFAKLLDFNGSILLCYSFIAFITYGTPTNFANNIKKRISDYLKRHHIDSLAELESLILEREILITEISDLEDSNNGKPTNFE